MPTGPVITDPSCHDVVAIARTLVGFPSITPAAGDIFDYLHDLLNGIGFSCSRRPFSGPGTARVDNLYARIGTTSPHFCFAGHIDVVPPGNLDLWRFPPFSATISDGRLYGRGAADMKGAIAAFLVAVRSYLDACDRRAPGSISILLTGDEEGPAINGSEKMLRWIADQGEMMDHCLVGEPTNPEQQGEMIKIGRRGSLNCALSVHGIQGHVAYPESAKNPIPDILTIATTLINTPLDHGTEHFQPSHLEFTSIDVDNPTRNLIPGSVTARFNIRFNTLHTAAALEAHLRAVLDAGIGTDGGKFDYHLECTSNAEAFLTIPGTFVDLVRESVRDITARTPALSTSGGTSDARFISRYCPVVEYGLSSRSIHQVDESVAVEDLLQLTNIYRHILERYFSGPSRLPVFQGAG